MKILLINDHINLSGGGDAVLHFEKEVFLDAGHEVYTLTFGNQSNNDGVNYIIETPVSGFKSKLKKFGSSGKLSKEITAAIYEISPDLIHIHLISKFPAAVYNSIALKHIPIIQTLHGPNLFCASSWGGLKNSAACELGIGLKCYTRGCVSLPNALLYSQLKERYWGELTSKINLFHCPSLNILNAANRLGLKNTSHIPLGIDEVFHEEPIKISNSRPTLLYVGALVEQKGVQYLLPALKIIKEEFPNVLLRIAGRGILLELLKQQVEEYELSQNVEFTGFVDHANVRNFYLTGDIFLMPSIWQEQFGLVGPEALACKVPCIGSNVGGIPEWLINNENGFLVPPQDVDELASAAIKLLKNPQLREEMGTRGREFVLKQFGSDKYRQALLDLINSFDE